MSRALAIIAVAAAAASVWFVESRPLERQPFPDSAEAIDVTRHLIDGEGFVTTIHGGNRRPSRYPPGFSLALVPFAAGTAPFIERMQRGSRAFAAACVVATAAAAWSIGGPWAAALAGAIAGVSPFARTEAAIVMSDGLSTALTLAIVPLLAALTRRRAATAGLIGGVLVTVRFQALLVVAALFVAVPRRFWLPFVAAAAPPIVALGIYQAAAFGSPLRTGYDYWLPGFRPFDLSYAFRPATERDGPWVVADALNGRLMSWVCPCGDGGPQASTRNVVFYPAVLAGVFWVCSPPFVTAVGAWRCWSRRREPTARFSLFLACASAVFFSLYFYQAARFMAPAASVLSVFGSIHIVEAVARRRHSRRGAVHADAV